MERVSDVRGRKPELMQELSHCISLHCRLTSQAVNFSSEIMIFDWSHDVRSLCGTMVQSIFGAVSGGNAQMP